MTRQCLYCNKELSKDSASNFCSKECWTEYKKLKAMNIDADKQATILLKKPEGGFSKSASQARGTSSDIAALQKRLDAMERSFNDRFIELSDSIHSGSGHSDATSIGDQPESIKEMSKRLIQIEQDLDNLEQTFRTASKMESRLVALEKKIRELESSVEKKRGFFARLFG